MSNRAAYILAAAILALALATYVGSARIADELDEIASNMLYVK